MKLEVLEAMDAEEFGGLVARLELCEGARVLLTANLWPEAGLMNGALGWCMGYIWPDGGDPLSKDSTLRAPLCVLVEFDELNLKDEHGNVLSFFPDDPDKQRWVPIYRKKESSSSEEGVARQQFPLTLAWAFTHWKSQGMNLALARARIGAKVAGQPGVGYVSVSRVKHPRHLVFDADLPPWSAFQKARETEKFRVRLRFELRLQARFSRTLRKYGFCRADPWTREEAAAAEELLKGLRAKGQMQRSAISQTGKPCDEDAHIWPHGEPPFDKMLAAEVQELAGGDASRKAFLLGVADRLRGELHMPAVREALGCLIPEGLHPRLDGKKAKGVKGDAERVGVHLEADRWTLDVSHESALAVPGRAMSKGALEFFLKVVRRICTLLDLPVAVGFTALGQRVGGDQSVDDLCRSIEGWKSWNFKERERARSSEEFLLPVCLDAEGRGSNDWLLAVVTSAEAGERLGVGKALRVRVIDRFPRPQAAQTVARKLQAVIGGVGAGIGIDVQVEMEESSLCDSRHESMILVLDLLLGRVAQRAGVSAMDSKCSTFVRDVRRALCAAFAAMRAQADASGHRDVYHDLATQASCRSLLQVLVTRPALPETVRAGADPGGAREERCEGRKGGGSYAAFAGSDVECESDWRESGVCTGAAGQTGVE